MGKFLGRWLPPLHTASGTPGVPSHSQVPIGAPIDPSYTGGPPASDQVQSYVPSEDTVIPGAARINPAYAGDFYAGRFLVQRPVPGDNIPAEVKSLPLSQAIASFQNTVFWKKRTAPKESDAVRFGTGAPQKPFKYPWNKKLIPPLALFNDASQWVNTLMFHRPMTWFDADTSNPPLKAQYFTPPPVNTNNLAAGTLNLQIQLGNIKIQAARLSANASDYFG